MATTTMLLAQQIEALRREVRALGSTPQLRYSAIDNGAVTVTSGGTTTAYVGVQYDGTSGAVAVSGPVPPIPVAPTLFQIIGGIRVVWGGGFVDPQAGWPSPVVAPMDFAYIEVQVDTTSDFSSGDVVVKHITSPAGGSADFVWAEAGANLWARIRTISAPGKQSAWSAVIGPLGSGGVDITVPDAPAGLSLTSFASLSATGDHIASITAQWNAPTANTDGTSFDDFSHYTLRYWWSSQPNNVYSLTTTGTTLTWDVGPGLEYNVEVAANDWSGHISVWSPTQSLTSAVDTTAPGAPSAPQVTNYLGQLRIYWNGLDSTGAAMPIDFSVVEVHVSDTSGFTPSTATLVSQLGAAGAAYATAPYGATRYVKLVAVDTSGNRSAVSTEVSGATSQVADGDIASLDVGKLTAGTISVDIVMGGRFATALTGARVEMNSLGFQKFDTDGTTLLVSITGTEALLTGVYKTASSGRRIEIGSGGVLGEIDFYAPDGTQTFVRAYTEATGTESIQFGVNVTAAVDPLWGRINYNHSGSGEYATYRSGTHEFVFDSSATNNGEFKIFDSLNRNSGTAVARLWIDATATHLADTTGTARVIVADNQVSLANSAGVVFFQVNDTGTAAFDTTNATRFQVADTGATALWGVDGTSQLAFQLLTDNNAYFVWKGTNNRVQIAPSDNTGNSAFVRLVHNSGYAISLYFRGNADGSSGRLSVADASATVYQPVWASDFAVQSSAAVKTDIAPLNFDAMATLRSAQVKSWRRVGPMGPDGKTQAPPGRVEYGLLAEEAPEQFVVHEGDGSIFGLSLGSQVGLLLAALQQLDKRLTTLEGSTT